MQGNFRIGTIELDGPFLLAPLAGITDSAFRRLCKAQGAAMVYSEMVSAKGLFYNDKATDRLLSFAPEETPIVYQLFGADPWIMAEAVRKLADRGNAGLDINMGCPVPKVVRNGEGAALMKDPKLAAEIVTAMVQAEAEVASERGRAPKPITVKCRIGWDTASINIREFGLRIEEAGATALAVHGRTRDQYYSGKADWSLIAMIKSALSIPVIGSGDALTAKESVELLEQTACDFVMIARGALGNPWIFRDALALYKQMPIPASPSNEEKLQMILAQLAMVIEEKGEAAAVREMRKHTGWYLKGVSGAAGIRRQVNTITSAKELRETLSKELQDSLNP